MEPLAVAAVVLLALLVGLAIPVLLQLRATLKSAERFLDTTSANLERTLGELTRLTTRLDHVVGEVEESMPRMKRVLDATDGLAATIDQVRGSVRAISAVGPAAFAAVKALMASFLASRAPPGDAAAAEADALDLQKPAQRPAAS